GMSPMLAVSGGPAARIADQLAPKSRARSIRVAPQHFETLMLSRSLSLTASADALCVICGRVRASPHAIAMLSAKPARKKPAARRAIRACRDDEEPLMPLNSNLPPVPYEMDAFHSIRSACKLEFSWSGGLPGKSRYSSAVN